LDKLCLKKAFLFELAIVEAREAQVPEKVLRDLPAEKVLGEVARKVVHLLAERVHALCCHVGIHFAAQRSCKQFQVRVEHIENV
jgi:hypothetical protein